VVGFEIEPFSIDSTKFKFTEDACALDASLLDPNTDANKKGQKLVFNQVNKISTTYEVVWQESDIPWASRWDSYLKMSDVQIHWFSIINSLVVVFFLAGILSMILIRSLRRDIAKYNREDEPVRSYF
jgi:transmembrane 9 superfamily protein 2/4